MPRNLWIAVASVVLSASLLVPPAFGFFGLFCRKHAAPAPAPTPVYYAPVHSCYGGAPAPYASCYGSSYHGSSCYGSTYQQGTAYYQGSSCYGSAYQGTHSHHSGYHHQSHSGCYGSQPTMQYYAPAPVYLGCYGR